MPMKNHQGFTLIELLVVIGLIGIIVTAISLQINPLEIIGRARDDVRKTDINAIADAYQVKAVDKNIYEPLINKDFANGKIPTPPEGGQYQGLLTEPQEYFFICAQLEKGKDLNCLLNSENINCYCKKSKNAPTPEPSPQPSFSPSPSPSGIGTSSPGPSPTLSPTPTPTGIGLSTPGPSPTMVATPTPTPTPSPASSSICIYQESPQAKPSAITMQGVDGTWCYDSDGNGGAGQGYCIDSNTNCSDFCENNYPTDTARDGYCTGLWWGAFWTNVHCEFGGLGCKSYGKVCSEGVCTTGTASPTPTPLPQSILSKRVFKTSTQYNGNLGGLSGADQKCQEKAKTASLGGVWKAWLSDGNTSASARLNHFNGPYILLDRSVVADNWSDLTDNTLRRNINITELGKLETYWTSVWTGTDPYGNSTGKNCLNWTTNWGWPYFGGAGSADSTISYWTQGLSDEAYCSSTYLSLYCFEQ